MTHQPQFRDLVGDDLPAEENQHGSLQRAHELLVEAGPPPELPPSLVEAPDRREEEAPNRAVRATERRRSLTSRRDRTRRLPGRLRRGSCSVMTTSPRRATCKCRSKAPGARGLIKLGEQDEAGNWPMVVTVKGLRHLPASGYYDCSSCVNGRPLKCGIFNVEAGETTMKFSVPYTFEDNDAWVVRRAGAGARKSPGRRC